MTGRSHRWRSASGWGPKRSRSRRIACGTRRPGRVPAFSPGPQAPACRPRHTTRRPRRLLGLGWRRSCNSAATASHSRSRWGRRRQAPEPRCAACSLHYGRLAADLLKRVSEDLDRRVGLLRQERSAEVRNEVLRLHAAAAAAAATEQGSPSPLLRSRQQACRSRSSPAEARGAGAPPAGQGRGRWSSSRTSTSVSAPSARTPAACACIAIAASPGQGLSRLPLVDVVVDVDVEDSNLHGIRRTLILAAKLCHCCVKNHAGFWA